MDELVKSLQKSEMFARIVSRLRETGKARLEGVWGSAPALLAAAVGLSESRVILCVTAHTEQAEEFVEDMNVFAPGLASYFPAWEALADDDAPDSDILARRVTLLRQLFCERDKMGRKVVVAPAQAVLQEVITPEAIEQNTLEIAKGERHDPDKVAAWLAERGFDSVPQVSAPGEYSRRGGILDIFPYVADLPARLEFFGDEVDSIRLFDPDTQTSVTETPVCRITAMAKSHEGWRVGPARSIFEYLPQNAWLMVADPAETLSRAETLESQAGALPNGEGRRRLASALDRLPTIAWSTMPGEFGADAMDLEVRSVERFGQTVESVLAEMATLNAAGRRMVVFCNNEAERSRFQEMLEGTELENSDNLELRVGRLNRGFDWPALGVALLPHHEMFHRYRIRRTPGGTRQTRPVDPFLELEPGDYVVHFSHGIGRFLGMEMVKAEDGQRRECLKIEYANGAYLFAPANKMDLVQKYVGPSETRPPLSTLGTATWSRQKERAEAACADMAADLLRMQAVRASKDGIAHPPDTEWQREFEQAFIYQETEDQITVAEEIKKDLESRRPMDRLLCGDVGYGKTELAMRAAFKVVMGGRQVAVLAPTTILAMQHYRSFKERMADYPVVVDMLSRFRTKGQQGATLAAMKEGRVDIVIGTHRLVQEDIAFKDLGLVVIDEEQRFGVEHKERLKRLRETVDVLTLTATPIPRTLHMSMMGLRDISTLQTPPRDRLAIQTRLWRRDAHKIRQAILREMARDGQVFFVHNRVETIDRAAQEVRNMVPEARVLVGHGQMREHELEDVMRRFIDHEADVLVCTTIIESGVDIPNVNTILLDEADMFGLSQLHQLRGRVGRYKHRAYAYLLLPRSRPLTPVAARRLKALEEFSDLGAGFRIAMRDLEIRGAGNILGAEQSGHIAAVGYELYCRLLEACVRRMRNEPPPASAKEVSLALGVDACLPAGYIKEPGGRIELYRRLCRAVSEEDVCAIGRETRDRYGPLPREAQTLLDEARLRVLCGRAGVRSVTRDGRSVTIEVEDMARAEKALASAAPRLRALDGKTLYMRLESADVPPEVVLRFLLRTLSGGKDTKR